MHEETILKSSIFGGYNKRDVIQYVDAVVEQTNKKAQGLEEQIALLQQENGQLKNRLLLERQPSLAPPRDTGSPLPRYVQEEERAPAPFSYAAPVAPPAPSQRETPQEMSIRQQMELPEGTYMVANERDIVTMPEPLPVYRTREKAVPRPTAVAEQTDYVLPEVLRAPEARPPEQAMPAMEQPKPRRFQGPPSLGATLRPGSYTAPTEDRTRAAQPTEAPSTYTLKLPPTEALMSEDVVKLQQQVASLKALLEKERLAKAKLAAQLEFSNNLLLQLYNNK